MAWLFLVLFLFICFIITKRNHSLFMTMVSFIHLQWQLFTPPPLRTPIYRPIQYVLKGFHTFCRSSLLAMTWIPTYCGWRYYYNLPEEVWANSLVVKFLREKKVKLITEQQFEENRVNTLYIPKESYSLLRQLLWIICTNVLKTVQHIR